MVLIALARMFAPADLTCGAAAIVSFPRSPFDFGPLSRGGDGGLMKTTAVGTATALAPAPALWPDSAEASTRAYAQGWQPAVADWLMSLPMSSAGSARRRWRSRAPFVPGSP